ncbi:MAG: peptide chain release factor N(5)-glutamine methyltransferase [Saccharofermentans sp.]|nr:peptide chain release factor N(5)-glutamine methyltransferase [Saccharofermentans sp.]
MTMSGDLITTNAINELIEAGIDKEDARLEVSLFEEAAKDDKELMSFISRRKTGEPMAYILGYRDFYRDRFKVAEGVLIPRSDTEILVETALWFAGALDFPTGDILKVPKSFNDLSSLNIVDLCTGTGCIGISVYNELLSKGRNVRCVLTDISDTALSCAKANIEALSKDKDNIRCFKEDVLDDQSKLPEESFDIVMSNPPYITAKDMTELDKTVGEHEPHLALFGGDDGMTFYPVIAKKAKKILKSGGALIVEHGYDQGEKVRNVFTEYGFNYVTTLKDYGGVDRVTFGVR